MEALYIKLYEKYSKLKSTKDGEIDLIVQDQEVKFTESLSAAESLIKHLRDYNEELRNEVEMLRSAKNQQFEEFQKHLMEEEQKNQQLSAEIKQLKNLQQKFCSSNRSDQPKKRRVISNLHSPTGSHSHVDEPTMRTTRKRSRLLEETKSDESPQIMTRKRARLSEETNTDESPQRTTRKRALLFEETNPATSSPSVRGELSSDQSKSDLSKTQCCRGIILNGGPCKCMFQVILECLTGMKVSVADQLEEQSMVVVHQSSGYSFSLTYVNQSDVDEGELLYNVFSLGTFTNVAPEWMREVIRFSMSMCPVFFKKVSRIIKND